MGNPQISIFTGDGGHDELIGAQSVGMKTVKAEWIKNRRDEDMYRFSDYRVQNATKFLSVIENIKINEKEVQVDKNPKEDIDDFIDTFNTDNSFTNQRDEEIVI